MPKRSKSAGKKKPTAKRPKTSAAPGGSVRETSDRLTASARAKSSAEKARAKPYTHPTHELAGRPEIGMQAQFRKKKAPKTYTYDSSLSPALDWDGQNAAREHGESLIQRCPQFPCSSMSGSRRARSSRR
jgi:hypothetical protein